MGTEEYLLDSHSVTNSSILIIGLNMFLGKIRFWFLKFDSNLEMVPGRNLVTV